MKKLIVSALAFVFVIGVASQSMALRLSWYELYLIRKTTRINNTSSSSARPAKATSTENELQDPLDP
ncbi:MAG: hypothetical protein ABIH22_03120 [Candidatus Margulisiibacteriota bacterium]